MAAGLGIGWGINWGSITLAANAVLDYLTFKLNFNTIATDFTFTRNSFATRVNEFGLIETVTDLGNDLIQNGSFDELGSERVINGDFENGENDWNFGGDWTLVNGTAEILTSTQSYLRSDNDRIPLTVKTYKLQYEVVTTNGSNLRLAGGSSAFGTATLDSATVGLKTVYLTSNGTQAYLQFNQNAFRGSIDNVSVKQVDPNDDWILNPSSGTAIISGGKLNFNNSTSSGAQVQQYVNSYVVGKTYLITYTVSDFVQGSVRVSVGNQLGAVSNSNGTFTQYVTYLNGLNRTYIYTGNSTLSIDNISIQEVLEDDVPRIDYTSSTFVNNLGSEQVINGDFTDGTNNWAAGAGATISVTNNQLTIEADNDFNFYARQSVGGFEVGKEYQLTIDVVGGTTSRMFVSVFGEGIIIDESPIIIGENTVSFTITSGSDGSRFVDIVNRTDDGVGDTLIINSISIKEVTGKITTDKGAFLLEPISTNLINYSEDFSDGSWAKLGNSASGFVTGVAPDGDTSVYEITSNGTGGKLQKTISGLSINTEYTLSFYAKQPSSTTLVSSRVLSLTGGSGGSNLTQVNYQDQLITDEWVRITQTFTTNDTLGSYIIYISNSLTGGESLQFWGAQLEELSYATSYIPTNGTTVTRAQESSIKNNVNGLFDNNVGSIYLAYDGVLTSGTTLNNMNPFRLYGQGSNRIRLYYTPDADFLGSSVDFENGGKIAWSCNGTTILTYINGALVDTHTITSNFTTLDNFILSTPFMTHRINDIKIYDKALTDGQLIELTTI